MKNRPALMSYPPTMSLPPLTEFYVGGHNHLVSTDCWALPIGLETSETVSTF